MTSEKKNLKKYKNDGWSYYLIHMQIKQQIVLKT